VEPQDRLIETDILTLAFLIVALASLALNNIPVAVGLIYGAMAFAA
jgi:hypothetical protein